MCATDPLSPQGKAERHHLAKLVFGKNSLSYSTDFPEVECATNSAGQQGFYVSTNAGGHRTAIHFHPDNAAPRSVVEMTWRLQGSVSEGYPSYGACAAHEWVPLNGPGFHGGASGYLAECPVPFSCIQGSHRGYSDARNDAPVRATYDGEIFTTSQLLTFSGNHYGDSCIDAAGRTCACDDEIPTRQSALWFTRLAYTALAAPPAAPPLPPSSPE